MGKPFLLGVWLLDKQDKQVENKSTNAHRKDQPTIISNKPGIPDSIIKVTATEEEVNKPNKKDKERWLGSGPTTELKTGNEGESWVITGVPARLGQSV